MMFAFAHGFGAGWSIVSVHWNPGDDYAWFLHRAGEVPTTNNKTFGQLSGKGMDSIGSVSDSGRYKRRLSHNVQTMDFVVSSVVYSVDYKRWSFGNPFFHDDEYISRHEAVYEVQIIVGDGDCGLFIGGHDRCDEKFRSRWIVGGCEVPLHLA